MQRLQEFCSMANETCWSTTLIQVFSWSGPVNLSIQSMHRHRTIKS